uniref:Protein kinase domain-containing protein n=3 Tax=Rhizophagus irregularis TaxID=588596 RepID=U9TE12_RHIID
MEVDNVYAAPPLINMQLHLEDSDTKGIKILLDGEVSQIIYYYDHREFKNLSKTIGFGGSASVYTAKWMETTTTYAIKRFRNSSRDDIINEVYLMGKVNCHPNIIKICGVTTLEGETNYSLILECADSGTLGEYLRENAATFRWEDQLKFANDIASAVLCLHSHQIIHGDLHPGNILIHQHSIKIADFGRSRLHGSVINKKEKAYGVIPYMDPKILKDHSCDLTEKSDIYSLGVLFWELTSRKSPFDFETKNNSPFEIIKIKSNILEGMREKPSPSTNHKFIALYKKCWQHEPNTRPEIRQVILELEELNNNEPLVVSEIFSSEEIETTLEISETPENDEVNVPSYDCDINKYEL